MKLKNNKQLLPWVPGPNLRSNYLLLIIRTWYYLKIIQNSIKILTVKYGFPKELEGKHSAISHQHFSNKTLHLKTRFKWTQTLELIFRQIFRFLIKYCPDHSLKALSWSLIADRWMLTLEDLYLFFFKPTIYHLEGPMVWGWLIYFLSNC